MSTSVFSTLTPNPDGCDGTLRIGVLVCLALLGAAAVAFYRTQNGGGRVGGEIAPQKMLWLLYAVILWIVLPLAIALDRRAHPALKSAFLALFALMALRGGIEMWMLYVSRNWSPWYGIAHDVLCVLVLGVGLVRSATQRAYRGRCISWLYVHLAVTAAAFLPEIYFAHFMATHFNTAGEAAIYFVPDDPQYREVLRVTSILVLALTVYLPVFLWGWLFGSAGSKRTPHG